MHSFLENIWEAEVRLLPLILAVFVFELSNIVRRITHIAYTPVYFAFFPLGHADSYYAYYFNEDEMYVGEHMTLKEKARLRKKIVSISSFSLAFSSILNPALCAIYAAIFLHQNEFSVLFWIIAVGKTLLISKSLYDNRYISFVDSSGAMPWLFLIYFAFITTVLYVLNYTYEWAIKIYADGGLEALAVGMLHIFYDKFLIGIVIAAIFGAAISYYMTDEAFIPEPIDESVLTEIPEALPFAVENEPSNEPRES